MHRDLEGESGKSKIAKRLQKHGDLDSAVAKLAQDIANAADAKARLQVLMGEGDDGWGFYLPMASAILTVLYPDEFTVYDTRVCDTPQGFGLYSKCHLDRIWDRYDEYRTRVCIETPDGLTLREKDKYLLGKSWQTQLTQDVDSGFSRLRRIRTSKRYPRSAR
ncbi:MAG: hypothetical protein IPK16_25895 [Anaerolineales bacterium]|nr:hypothetical protein [Anaerolineales bacterium]